MRKEEKPDLQTVSKEPSNPDTEMYEAKVEKVGFFRKVIMALSGGEAEYHKRRITLDIREVGLRYGINMNELDIYEMGLAKAAAQVIVKILESTGDVDKAKLAKNDLSAINSEMETEMEKELINACKEPREAGEHDVSTLILENLLSEGQEKEDLAEKVRGKPSHLRIVK
ncbi:hypothetical protein KKA95_01790 [Patescibacteria group bacterium]|nr:hypothetical protein [Patescibacteria group bacterium]